MKRRRPLTTRKAEIPLAETAQRLGVSWAVAWRKVLTGELEGRKNDRGKWVVTEESVTNLLAARAGTR